MEDATDDVALGAFPPLAADAKPRTFACCRDGVRQCLMESHTAPVAQSVRPETPAATAQLCSAAQLPASAAHLGASGAPPASQMTHAPHRWHLHPHWGKNGRQLLQEAWVSRDAQMCQPQQHPYANQEQQAKPAGHSPALSSSTAKQPTCTANNTGCPQLVPLFSHPSQVERSQLHTPASTPVSGGPPSSSAPEQPSQSFLPECSISQQPPQSHNNSNPDMAGGTPDLMPSSHVPGQRTPASTPVAGGTPAQAVSKMSQEEEEFSELRRVCNCILESMVSCSLSFKDVLEGDRRDLIRYVFKARGTTGVDKHIMDQLSDSRNWVPFLESIGVAQLSLLLSDPPCLKTGTTPAIGVGTPSAMPSPAQQELPAHHGVNSSSSSRLPSGSFTPSQRGFPRSPQHFTGFGAATPQLHQDMRPVDASRSVNASQLPRVPAPAVLPQSRPSHAFPSQVNTFLFNTV